MLKLCSLQSNFVSHKTDINIQVSAKSCRHSSLSFGIVYYTLMQGLVAIENIGLSEIRRVSFDVLHVKESADRTFKLTPSILELGLISEHIYSLYTVMGLYVHTECPHQIIAARFKTVNGSCNMSK
jgi:hypothetical protein